MKRYTLSYGAAIGHQPEHPERTARRDVGRFLDGNVQFQEWPSRAAMLTTVEMQDRRVTPSGVHSNWRPIIPNCDHCMSYPHRDWCGRAAK